VLPASLALGTWTVAAAREDRTIRVLSEGQQETETFALDIAPGAAKKRWSDYIAGVTWALQQAAASCAAPIYSSRAMCRWVRV
jgi:VCBS repeat-containing protein